MAVGNSGKELFYLTRSVTLILYFFLEEGSPVLAFKDYTVKNIQTSLLPNDTLRISWNIVELRQPRKRWEVTHVTLQSINLTSSVRYPLRRGLYTVDYGIDDNGMHRGTKYDVIIQLVSNGITPVSNEETVSVIIPPRKPMSFSAVLSYNNFSRNGYPRFIEFNYHLQRRSLYSGVLIECGNRSADGTLSIRFRENIDFEYSSKYENIALRQTTFMSTTRRIKNGFPLRSSYAADGVVWLNANRAQTWKSSYSHWWTVELERLYKIQTVILYKSQAICGGAYCSRFLRSFKIFSGHPFNGFPCMEDNRHKEKAHRRAGLLEMVIVQQFKPAFNSKYVTICGFVEHNQPMTLLEVEVFTPEKSIRQIITRRREIDELPPGTYIDCNVFTTATIHGKEIRSLGSSLTEKVLTPPPPPRDIVYDYTEDGSHLILFDLEASALATYEYIQIAFLLDGNLYTLNNSLRFTYHGGLLPGQRYVLKTWTSTTLPIGKVKSLQNATFAFVAGGEIVTPKGIVKSSRHSITTTKTTQQTIETRFTRKVTQQQTTELNTPAKPDILTTAIYVLGFSSISIFSLVIVLVIRKKVKRKLSEENLKSMHSNFRTVHVYDDLLRRVLHDALAEYMSCSTTHYSLDGTPENESNCSRQTENMIPPSLLPTYRIKHLLEPVAVNNLIISQALDSAVPPDKENMDFSTTVEPSHELGLSDSIKPDKKRKLQVKKKIR